MGISSLLRFANWSDMQKAISDPRRAIRVIKRSIFKNESTHVEDSTVLDPQRKEAFELLFESESYHVDELLEELRTSEIQERILECKKQFNEWTFEPGGMNAGGETAYLAARLLEPESILEVGVANGISTAYILGAVTHSDIECDIRAIDKPLFAQDVREKRGKRGLKNVGGIIPDSHEAAWIAPKSQRKRHGYQYYVGNFTNILPSVTSDIGNIDLAIYDASKDEQDMRMAYETIADSLSPGAILISDDINASDAFENTFQEKNGRVIKFAGCGIFRSNK